MVLGFFVHHRDERNTAKRSDQYGLRLASKCDGEKLRRHANPWSAGDIYSPSFGSQRHLRGRNGYSERNHQRFRCGNVACIHGQCRRWRLCSDCFGLRGRLPGDLFADKYGSGDHEFLAERDDHQYGDHAEPRAKLVGACSAWRANGQPELQ